MNASALGVFTIFFLTVVLLQEKRLKKAIYQEELRAQIETRQREKERQQALDLEEEERMNRYKFKWPAATYRMKKKKKSETDFYFSPGILINIRKIEAQQKLLQLQEELDRRRHTQTRDHPPINIKVTPPSAAGSSARRSDGFDVNAHTFRSHDERQTASHKENIDDKKAYRYFSNATRDASELMDLRAAKPAKFGRSPIHEHQKSPKRQSYNTYPAHKSNAAHHGRPHHQQSPPATRPLCHFCKNKRLLGRSQLENVGNGQFVCGSCENVPICLSCRQELCSRCKKPIKIAPGERSNEATPHKVNIGEWLSSNSLTSELKLSPMHTDRDTYRIDTTTDDDENATNSPGRPPYSFNIKETSIFHPSYSFRESPTMPSTSAHIPFDELKRITDEKLSRLSQNYGELAGKQFIERTRIGSVDSFPMPLLRDHADSAHGMPWTETGPSSDGNSNAFKRVQTKWQVSGAQWNWSNWPVLSKTI